MGVAFRTFESDRPIQATQEGQTMTIPKHFSHEVSQRALEPICKFYDRLPECERKGFPEATFLLSVSMPIVILPIERIQKHTGSTIGHMDDTAHNKDLANAIKKTVNMSEKVHNKKFFADMWQYASLKKEGGFPNLAVKGLPEKIVEELNSQKEATKRAGQLSTLCFFKILRNALAHGGVLYLDECGDSRPDAIVHRFAFVSTDRQRKPTELRFLQIKVIDYRKFLERWVKWMDKQVINRAMADDLGLDAHDKT